MKNKFLIPGLLMVLISLSACEQKQSDPINEIIGDNLAITPYNYSNLCSEFNIDREKFVQNYAGKELFVVLTFKQQTNDLHIDNSMIGIE